MRSPVSVYADPPTMTPSIERTALRWGAGGALAILAVAGGLALVFARGQRSGGRPSDA
jgi:hypothetical protein